MTTDTDINETPRFCMTPRFALISWGNFKIIIDFLIIPVTIKPLVDVTNLQNFFDYLAGLIFALLAALVIADIVFQAKLNYGLLKNKVKHLTAYCKYTKVLWVLMLLIIAVFTILIITGMFCEIFGHYRDESFFINTGTMSVGIIFQTLMLLLVVNEIKKLNGDINENSGHVYSFRFTVKIETTRNGEKKEDNSDNIEEFSEKTKLIV